MASKAKSHMPIKLWTAKAGVLTGQTLEFKGQGYVESKPVPAPDDQAADGKDLGGLIWENCTVAFVSGLLNSFLNRMDRGQVAKLLSCKDGGVKFQL